FKVKAKDKDKEVEHRDSMDRDTALKYIAERQLAADKIADALTTVRSIESPVVGLYPMRDVIIARGKTDTVAAGKLLAEMEKDSKRWKGVLIRPRDRVNFFASTRAALGDAAGALKWIEKLDSDEERASALLGVSIGLAERKRATKGGKNR